MSLLDNQYFNLGANILAANKGSALQPIGQGIAATSQQRQQQQVLDMQRQQQEALHKYRELQARQLEYQMSQPPERKTVMVDGVPYYMDTQQPVVPNAPRNPNTNLGKLKQEQQAYPVGSDGWNYYEQAIQKEATNLPTGMIMGPDGRPQYMPEYLQGQQQIQSAGASNFNVNAGQGPRYEVGAIPQGYRQAYDEHGRPTHQEPMEGGPAAREIADAEDAMRRQQELTARQLQPTIDDIQTLRDMVSAGGFPSPVGQMSGLTKRIPMIGQRATDIGATIDAIGSGISLENLNQMRQASPTGGALGNVSDKQSGLLAEAFGSLSQSLSPELFLYNLNRVENTLNDIVHGVGNGPQRHDLVGMRERLRREMGVEAPPPIQVTTPYEKMSDEELERLYQERIGGVR